MSEAGNVWSYVIGAYAVAWAGLLGYSIRLWALNRRARSTAAAVEGGDR